MYFGSDKRNAVKLPHSVQRKHAFTEKIKNMSKKNIFPARKTIALELLHQILGQRSTRSLLAGDTDNLWEDAELRIYPDPFFTPCQIYSMNKKARSKFHSSQRHPSSGFLWI